jgi:hypothetical protein
VCRFLLLRASSGMDYVDCTLTGKVRSGEETNTPAPVFVAVPLLLHVLHFAAASAVAERARRSHSHMSRWCGAAARPFLPLHMRGRPACNQRPNSGSPDSYAFIYDPLVLAESSPGLVFA